MSGDHNQYQKPTGKDSLQVKAMRQAIQALAHTDTHPITSAEQYFIEMNAMEALEDAIDDAEEREWVGLTDDEITELFCDYDGSQFPAFARAIEAKLKEKNL
jgi:hypothetical protein